MKTKFFSSFKIILIMLFSTILISKEPAKNIVKVKKELVSLHKIDWYNYEYVPGWMTLKNGSGEVHDNIAGGAHTINIWNLKKICYGDINNDKTEDAVIVIKINKDNVNHIYTIKDNKIIKLFIKTSDKIDLSKLKCEPKKVFDDN